MKKSLAFQYVSAAVLIATGFVAIFLDATGFAVTTATTNGLAYSLSQYDDDDDDRERSNADATFGHCGSSSLDVAQFDHRQVALSKRSKKPASKRTNDFTPRAITGSYFSALIPASCLAPHDTDRIRSCGHSFSLSGLSPPILS